MEHGERVEVLPLGTQPTIVGTITNIRRDDRDVPILTITLDDPSLTTDGYYLARTWEVRPVRGEP